MALKIVHSTNISLLKRNMNSVNALVGGNVQKLWFGQMGMRKKAKMKCIAISSVLGTFCSRFTRKTIIKVVLFYSAIIYYYKSICVRNEKWLCAAVAMKCVPVANLCIGNYGKCNLRWNSLIATTVFKSNYNEKYGNFSMLNFKLPFHLHFTVQTKSNARVIE